jgi:GAF domain-containing protein
MSLRLRLTLLMLVAGILPLLTAALAGGLLMGSMQDSALKVLQTHIEQTGMRNIQQAAQRTAGQMEAYLELHPQLNPHDEAALMRSEELYSISVQILGNNGYTMVFNDQLEVIYHPDRDLTGSNLDGDVQQPEVYSQILSSAASSRSADGFFDWVEDDRRTKRKYMASVQVGNTPLRAAGIIDGVEIYQALLPARQDLLGSTDQARQNFILLSVVVMLAYAAAAYYLAGRLAERITAPAEAARCILDSLPDTAELPGNPDDPAMLPEVIGSLAARTIHLRQDYEEKLQAAAARLERLNRQAGAVLETAQLASAGASYEQIETRASQLIKEAFDCRHSTFYWADGAGSGDPADLTMPSLNQSHSEVRLPVLAGGEMVGVLEAYSSDSHHFTLEDIRMLQILADQAGMALHNARLSTANREMEEEIRRLYGEEVEAAWGRRRMEQPLAFELSGNGVAPVERLAILDQPGEDAAITSGESGNRLVVPILLRGQRLGAMTLERDAAQESWRPEDLSFIQDLLQQAAPALENARLLEEMNRQAQIEQKIGEISAKAFSTLSLESVVRTAIQELGSALDAEKVQIRWKPAEVENGRGAGSE